MRRRSIIAVTLGLLAGGLLGAAWLIGIGTATWPGFPRPFDAGLWRAAATGVVDGMNDVRCRMVQDLRYRIGLNGRTPGQVIELLGDEREGRGGLPDSYVLCPTMADYMVLRLLWKGDRVVGSELHQS